MQNTKGLRKQYAVKKMWWECHAVYVRMLATWCIGSSVAPCISFAYSSCIHHHALNSHGTTHLPLVTSHFLSVRDYSGDTEWLTKTWHKDFEIPITHPHPYLITISRMIAGKVRQYCICTHAYLIIVNNCHSHLLVLSDCVLGACMARV